MFQFVIVSFQNVSIFKRHGIIQKLQFTGFENLSYVKTCPLTNAGKESKAH